VEGALQEVRADTKYGALLVGISDYLLKVVRVENDERERHQARQTGREVVTPLERS
jgi:hypothetical protein